MLKLEAPWNVLGVQGNNMTDAFFFTPELWNLNHAVIDCYVRIAAHQD
jgi:hypothetical protein